MPASTATRSQPRQPAGSSTGGEWREHTGDRSASGVRAALAPRSTLGIRVEVPIERRPGTICGQPRQADGEPCRIVIADGEPGCRHHGGPNSLGRNYESTSTDVYVWALMARASRLNEIAERQGLDARVEVRYNGPAWLDRNLDYSQVDGPIPMMQPYAIASDPIVMPGGYRYVATVRHTTQDVGDGAFRSVDGLDHQQVLGWDEATFGPIPAGVAEASITCDHCGTKRRRNETVIVADNDGNLLNIGSSCVQAFLGMSPEYLSAYAALEDPETAAEKTRRARATSPATEVFVIAAAAETRRDGFRNAKQGRNSTALAAMDLVQGARATEITDADVQFAVDALAWARGLGADGAPLGDFERNLRAAALGTAVDKNAGLLAYVPSAYQRWLAGADERARREAAKQEAARARAASRHQGTVGEKHSTRLTVTGVATHTAYVGYQEVTKATISAVDGEGNQFVVHTTAGTEFERYAETGAVLDVVGKVVRHGEFRGAQQTQLERVKVAGFHLADGRVATVPTKKEWADVADRGFRNYGYEAARKLGFSHADVVGVDDVGRGLTEPSADGRPRSEWFEPSDLCSASARHGMDKAAAVVAAALRTAGDHGEYLRLIGADG